MVPNSIRAGIGTRRVSGDARSYSDYVHSGEPFKTSIGVGKVIKGWDEGELLIRLVGIYCDSHPLPLCVPHTGVPQLSLGEKAVLTATPDFVSLELDLILHAAGGLSLNRHMVLVDSHRSSHPTPPSSSKSSCSVSMVSQLRGDVVRCILSRSNLFAHGMDRVLSVLHFCIVCDPPIFTRANLVMLEPCFGAVCMDCSRFVNSPSRSRRGLIREHSMVRNLPNGRSEIIGR